MVIIEKEKYYEIDIPKSFDKMKLNRLLKKLEIYEMASEINMPKDEFENVMNEVENDIREYSKKWVDGN